MTRLAVDASFALKWCFADEVTTLSELALKALLSGSASAITTSIFALEVANITLSGERRKRISMSESQAFTGLLLMLPIEVLLRPLAVSTGTVLDLARQYSLTAYDAAYLELASAESVPLATSDIALQRACTQMGVRLLTGADLDYPPQI